MYTAICLYTGPVALLWGLLMTKPWEDHLSDFNLSVLLLWSTYLIVWIYKEESFNYFFKHSCSFMYYNRPMFWNQEMKYQNSLFTVLLYKKWESKYIETYSYRNIVIVHTKPEYWLCAFCFCLRNVMIDLTISHCRGNLFSKFVWMLSVISRWM